MNDDDNFHEEANDEKDNCHDDHDDKDDNLCEEENEDDNHYDHWKMTTNMRTRTSWTGIRDNYDEDDDDEEDNDYQDVLDGDDIKG